MGAKSIRRPYMEIPNIYDATAALESGSITSTMFLDRLGFSTDQICTDREIYEDIFKSFWSFVLYEPIYISQTIHKRSFSAKFQRRSFRSSPTKTLKW